MARPSQNLDRALLEAGFAELERGGVRGLSVRAVCARAGVNVRMLNYHFGSKDEFVRQLLNKTYQYFFNELSVGVRHSAGCLPYRKQLLVPMRKRQVQSSGREPAGGAILTIS